MRVYAYTLYVLFLEANWSKNRLRLFSRRIDERLSTRRLTVVSIHTSYFVSSRTHSHFVRLARCGVATGQGCRGRARDISRSGINRGRVGSKVLLCNQCMHDSGRLDSYLHITTVSATAESPITKPMYPRQW